MLLDLRRVIHKAGGSGRDKGLYDELAAIYPRIADLFAFGRTP